MGEANLEEVMRVLRFLHMVFIMSVIAFIAVGEFVPLPRNTEMDIMVPLFGLVAIADLGLGFFLRKNTLDQAREILQRDRDNKEAVESWRRGHFLGFVFAETIVFFGLAIRLLTGNLQYAIPFYIAGLAALIFWMPRRHDA